MARALRAGKNSVRNLRYGPRTRLVRDMSRPAEKEVCECVNVNTYLPSDCRIALW